jgi:hypothetical protein
VIRLRTPEGRGENHPKPVLTVDCWRAADVAVWHLTEITIALPNVRFWGHASGVPLNMDYPFNGAFFDMLARFIASETVDPMDADWRGMLAAIGIIKGKPFNPDARTRAILDTAAKTAFKMSRAMIYADLEGKSGALIYTDRHWVDPILSGAADVEWLDKSGTFRSLDLRTGVFSIIYASSPGMVSITPGQGARYLTAFRDSDGDYLSGDKSYRLHLPPNVPAAIFWSATLYDPETASGLDNGQPFPSISSRDKPVANADGSYDIYFGPTAPAGKETNWRRTLPDTGFFLILRLYGPKEAYFNKTWKPSDIEKVN